MHEGLSRVAQQLFLNGFVQLALAYECLCKLLGLWEVPVEIFAVQARLMVLFCVLRCVVKAVYTVNSKVVSSRFVDNVFRVMIPLV